MAFTYDYYENTSFDYDPYHPPAPGSPYAYHYPDHHVQTPYDPFHPLHIPRPPTPPPIVYRPPQTTHLHTFHYPPSSTTPTTTGAAATAAAAAATAAPSDTPTSTATNTATNTGHRCPHHHQQPGPTCLTSLLHCCRGHSPSRHRTTSRRRSSPHVHFATTTTTATTTSPTSQAPSRSHSRDRDRDHDRDRTISIPVQEVITWNSAPLADYRISIEPTTNIENILRALGVGGREARLYSGSRRRSWMLGDLQERETAEAMKRVRMDGAYIEVIRR